MSEYLHYCHICGKILDKSEIYQLIERDWDTGKKHKLYETCEPCMINIERRRFAMPHIRNHKKKIVFTSIFKKEFSTGKTKHLYDVLPEQLEKLKSLEVSKDDLVLKTKFNKRYWTEGAMRRVLETSDEQLMKAVVKLYDYQTDDEKKGRETIHDNAVGFNKPDASFLTGMARLYSDQGLEKMTDKQIAKTRKLMLKYIAQLTIIANA